MSEFSRDDLTPEEVQEEVMRQVSVAQFLRDDLVNSSSPEEVERAIRLLHDAVIAQFQVLCTKESPDFVTLPSFVLSMLHVTASMIASVIVAVTEHHDPSGARAPLVYNFASAMQLMFSEALLDRVGAVLEHVETKAVVNDVDEFLKGLSK